MRPMDQKIPKKSDSVGLLSFPSNWQSQDLETTKRRKKGEIPIRPSIRGTWGYRSTNHMEFHPTTEKTANLRVLSEPQGMRIHLLISHAPESIYWEDIFSESREWERSKVILSFETTILVLFLQKENHSLCCLGCLPKLLDWAGGIAKYQMSPIVLSEATCP